MKFELLQPHSLPEAIEVISRKTPEIKVMAGGTDLLIRIKRRAWRPRIVLSLARIDELKRLEYIPGHGLVLGALVTHAELASLGIVGAKYPALGQACRSIGSPQIRNLGTVGGNLCNGSPAADSFPALLVYEASAMLVSPRGERSVPVNNLLAGPGATCLAPDELLKAIYLPDPKPGTTSVYLKLGRRQAMEIAIASVALAARQECGVWYDCRLALGAVAPTPFLCASATAVMEGQAWDETLLQAVAAIVKQACAPIDDQRASARYRRDMAAALTIRAANNLLASKGAWAIGRDN